MALAGFVFVGLLAASPALHEAFHGGDASSPTHQCAAVLLATAQVLFSPAPLSIPFSPTPFLWSLLESEPVTLAGDLRLPRGRAPPSVFS